MVALIIDIQYYPVNGQHELKEATILPLSSSNHHSHFVFLNSPQFCELSVKDRKTARFINEELSVIHYNCGVDLLQDFLDHIPRDALLFVNGHVKKKIFKSLLPQYRIIDVKIPFNCLSSSKMCDFPYLHTQCSLRNCYKLKSCLYCN